jgi:hypothetical protein
MRSTLVARLVAATAALAVAVALLGAEDERRTCERATEGAYGNARASVAVLKPAVERLVSRCDGSEPLIGVSLGLLQLDRRHLARRLARVAADREPDSYVAWAVLQHTAPGQQARTAALHVRELNPLASRDAGP